MIIDKNWTLLTAFEHINKFYTPGGQFSGPQRNRLVETWGQLVGKSRALKEFDSLLETCGSMNKASKIVQMRPGTMKVLKSFFESLPDELEHVHPLQSYSFREGDYVSMEEDLTHEFKEIKGNNPAKSIQNIVDEYILAFLNSTGGSVFWGIADDSKVKSVNLNSEQKDSIRKVVNSKIKSIEPSIDPTKIKIVFHSVQGAENGYVIQVDVPKSNSVGLYFNSSGNTWVRLNGCKQKLQGVALQEHIFQRFQVNN